MSDSDEINRHHAQPLVDEALRLQTEFDAAKRRVSELQDRIDAVARQAANAIRADLKKRYPTAVLRALHVSIRDGGI